MNRGADGLKTQEVLVVVFGSSSSTASDGTARPTREVKGSSKLW